MLSEPLSGGAERSHSLRLNDSTQGGANLAAELAPTGSVASTASAYETLFEMWQNFDWEEAASNA